MQQSIRPLQWNGNVNMWMVLTMFITTYMKWARKGWVCYVMTVHKQWSKRKQMFIPQCTVQKHSSQVWGAWRTHNIYDLRDSFLLRSLTFCRNIILGCFFVSCDGTGDQQGLKENKSGDELQNVWKPQFSTSLSIYLKSAVSATYNKV